MTRSGVLWGLAALLAASLLPKSGAWGEEAGRAAWMKQARWGVMTHYLADRIAADRKPPASSLSVSEWNELVNQFDVNGLADSLQKVGAGYLIFTIGQNSGFYVAPNATYDRLVGSEPGKCLKRDLIDDLARALHLRGIKLIVYLPAGAPARDRDAVDALEWKNGANRNAAFQRKWEAVIREWSSRWGGAVDGWWFDGCYWPNTMYRTADPPNFASFAAAARAGNPSAVVAFNPGVVDRSLSVTPEEDYTAGEINDPDRLMIRRAVGGVVDGVQVHVLTYLGSTWGKGEPRFNAEQLATHFQRVARAGGILTCDVPIGRNGLITQPFLELFVTAGKTMKTK